VLTSGTIAALAVALLAAVDRAPPPAPAAVAPKPGSAAPVPKPERVALRFAWPDGLAGVCEWSHVQTRAGRPLGSFAVKFKLGATRKGGEVQIEKVPLALPVVEGEIARAVADLWPGSERFSVDARGRVLRYEDLDAAVDAMDGALAPLTAGLPAASRARILEAAREALPRRARDEWFPLVGFWAGAPLDAGVPRVEEVAGSGTRSRARLEYTFEERTRCGAEQKAKDGCVRLALRTTWTDRGGGAAKALLPEGAAAEKGAPPVRYEEESILVTDPATLVPHHFERRRTGRLAVVGAAAKNVELVLEKRWTLSCTWDR
jgi:hypothetical protein